MNPATQARLLTDAELARLDALLEAASPDESMMLEELDGFFAALACSPQPVPPEEYLPVVLGREPGAPQPDGRAASMQEPRDAKELETLLARHREAVAAQLYDGEGYSPVLGYDDDGKAQGNAWAIGFVRGMAMRPDAWVELEDDEEFGDALDPLMRLVEEVEPEDDAQVAPVSDAEREPLIEAMFEGVMEVYDYFRAQRERNLAPPPSRRAQPKVGRNDPCPCGSGKKFKLCCGAEPARH